MPRVKLTETKKKEPVKTVTAETPRLKKQKMKAASQLKASYCRHCNKMLEYKEFQPTTNPFIDKNGCMSICKGCLEKIFFELYHTYNDYNKAFYAFCQHADIMYDEICVNDAIKYLEEHPNGETIITKYWRAVRNNNREKPIRYRDSKANMTVENSMDRKISDEERKKLKLTWGEFKDQDYLYLENTFKEYTTTFGIAGPNERDGYRVLAMLLLKQRETPANKDIIGAIKAQYEMLGIDPKQIRKENKEQGAMTLGLTISQMEQTDPADYFNDPEKYVDHSGIQKDLKSIIRATKNFLIEGNNDFKEDDIDMSQIYDSEVTEE